MKRLADPITPYCVSSVKARAVQALALSWCPHLHKLKALDAKSRDFLGITQGNSVLVYLWSFAPN